MASTPKRASRKRKIESVYETPTGQSRITQHFPVAKTPRRTMKALTLCRPDTILCREKELTSLRQTISAHVKAKTPGSLYIPGPPGTGKTLCVTEVVREVEKGQGVKVIQLNCMTLSTQKAIFGSLGRELIGNSKAALAEGCVEKFVCSSKDSIIVVLEEVDQLMSSGKGQMLYRLFELPALENSRLILIAVSNVLDLADRALPRLHTNPKLRPTIIPFRPYSREEVFTILHGRLGDMNDEIHPNALRFCASKVSARNGDIRDALNHCRAAIQANRGQQVNVREINQIIGATTGSSGMSTLTWPLLHKLAACTLLQTKENHVSIAKLYDRYREVCAHRKLKHESEETFSDALGTLEIRGVIKIQAANRKALRDRKVSLCLTRDQLEFKLRDKTLINSILES